jgi:hypothetical protein
VIAEPELRRRLLRWLTPLLALATVVLAPAVARADFQTGLQDPEFDGTATAQQTESGYKTLSATGGSVVRLNAFWYQIAGAAPEPGFQATDPADREYQWGVLDAAVRQASQRHVRVLLTVSGAPGWAQGPNQPKHKPIGTGAWDPNPTDYGQFAQAVAKRYSGRFADPLNPGQTLPRVKYIELWNEENLPAFLAAPNLFDSYRALLTDGYNGVKAAEPSDKVIFGGLAPVSYLPGTTVSPLKMAAEMMCLRRVGREFVRLGGGCKAAPFDIFAEHPYTLEATPTDPAGSYDDVLVADIPKLRDLLNAARRLHTVAGANHPLWVTEWGWVTKPPDNLGDHFNTAARYVAYAMYEMWRAGVSVVIWQGITDASPNQLLGSGLETKSLRPKPQMQAFTFPFIASVAHRKGFAWGRVPGNRRVRVTVQRHTAHGWRRVTAAWTGRDGVFSVRFAANGNATYRGHVTGGPNSLPYFSAAIPAQRTHGG